MNMYLILHGADNDMATFEAETPEQALEDFNEYSRLYEGGSEANQIFICTEIKGII